MKRIAHLAVIGALVATAGAGQLDAQSVPVMKDRPQMSTTDSFGDIEFTPTGYRLRPGGQPLYCSDRDSEGVATVAIGNSELRQSDMISPEQAKALALCAVPGQITSGEMENRDGRTYYNVTIIPNGKQTHSKVEIDARTGEVTNAKQFGGLRGLSGWLRESAERKKNTP